MKIDKETFGRELSDGLHGRADSEIVERDDGYIDSSWALKTYFSSYKDWPPHQKKAMKLVRGRVLDIGCGAGRHAIYLQRKGFRVTGVDQSAFVIKVAKRRGLKDGRRIAIAELDRKAGGFDTIIMMGNNFGLFGNCRRAKSLLRRFLSFTSDKARIVAECVDPYATDFPLHLAYHRRNRRRGRMGGQLRIRIRYQDRATPWFDYLFVSRDELREILRGTGWEIRRVIGSRRAAYVAVIEKTAAPRQSRR